jgi:predicted SnoaL-like aldol condensation-catalyzing enzyme
MSQSTEARNKAIVLQAFDTLFNKRDYGAAARFWSPNYVQHSAHIVNVQARARADCGGRRVRDRAQSFLGFGQAKNWIVAGFVRVVDGILVEHWDVVEDEASQSSRKAAGRCSASVSWVADDRRLRVHIEKYSVSGRR